MGRRSHPAAVAPRSRRRSLLLPIARGASWDVIVEGRFSTDVAGDRRGARRSLRADPIDPTAVALAGSSDGASYAISLGLVNGGLFPFVIGASPGFVADAERRGTPDVFVSHGRHDPTSPIDRTSGEIVPALREDGYDVAYVEFDGGHELPPTIARRQIGWFPQRAARR